MAVVMPGEVAEGRGGTRVAQIGLARHQQHVTQLLEVVLVGQLQVLVEPLGRHHLGRGPPLALAALEFYASPRERLRALRERHDAEAERQAQHHGPLEQLDLANRKAQLLSHAPPVLPRCP
jgi:hypothetical protein